MITHEEARKAKLRLARHENDGFQGAEYGRTYNVDNAIQDSKLLDEYFLQQEKEAKLLELYRLEKELKEKYHTGDSLYIMLRVLNEIRDVAEEIQQLEEELK